jgi:hypothetical protein
MSSMYTVECRIKTTIRLVDCDGIYSTPHTQAFTKYKKWVKEKKLK